jgi:enamine deaminase RidA (YjgF/YER057c/UK114 family)
MRFPKALAVLVILGGVLVAAQPGQKPMKQFLNPEWVKRPVHGYTSVVTSAPGRMIFISGQGGAAADGQLPADFTSQAKNTFENLGRCLHAAGANFDDIVKINYYLTDVSNITELRRIRAQYLNQSAPPASTIVQAVLGEKGTLLEAEAIAIVPE